MSDRLFRFGVVGVAQAGATQWRETARRVEQLGYATLLTPDNLGLAAPTVSLAIAAAVTTTLRVGTFVLASPLRTPRAAAWDAHSLSVLTDNRFELGLGTGLPAMRQAAEELGLPYGSAARRLAQVSETIDHLRALEDDRRTPILIAAGGPKARALAATKADIVTLANSSLTPRDEIAEAIAEVRRVAGDRADRIEFAMNIFMVGEELPQWTQQFIGADAATLIAHDSLTMLRGGTQDMVDELQRRRDQFRVSYISVNSAFYEQLAPVVERLAGR
jgi:probable F420-dependent oxidoreductase